MKNLSSILWCLSIVIINPFASNAADVATNPKLFIVMLITALNVATALWMKPRWTVERAPTARSFIVELRNLALFWVVILIFGLASTFQSPVPDRSIWGSPMLGDGLIYWLFMSVFVISEALLLQAEPSFLNSRINGIVFGAVLLALMILFQSINNGLDIVTTLGLPEKDFESAFLGRVWDINSPIGFFSHRGHAAAALAMGVVVAVFGIQKKSMRRSIGILAATLILTGLILAQTRGAVLAAICALIYFVLNSKFETKILINKRLKFFLGIFAVLLLVVAAVGLTGINKMRGIPSLTDALQFENSNDQKTDVLDSYTQDRSRLWKIALHAIRERPLIGWGYGGYGVAYPFVTGCAKLPDKSSSSKLEIESFDSQEASADAARRGRPGMVSCDIPMNKAHNILLDSALSTGAIGMLFYIFGFFYFLRKIAKSKVISGLESVGIAYIIFGLTWYECAQFSHLPWGVLGAGIGCLGHGGRAETPEALES